MFFSSASVRVSEESLADLHGKIVIVTGGNTGIGYATVEILARKGAKVYLAVRDGAKANSAIEQLRRDNAAIADDSLHSLILDLSDLHSVKRAAEEFLQKETRLDVLVNNAAVGAWIHTLREDGMADVMAVNHIGHFALVEALLPLLKATAQQAGSDVRIVNLTSVAHDRVSPTSFVGKASFSHIGNGTVTGNLDAYGYSKLANILHIKELQLRFDHEGLPITCTAVHPGPVKTEGSDKFIASVPFIFRFLLPLVFGDQKNGALNVAFAAASNSVKEDRAKYKGAYLTPTARISQPSKSAQDDRLAKELYQTSLDILKEIGV